MAHGWFGVIGRTVVAGLALLALGACGTTFETETRIAPLGTEIEDAEDVRDTILAPLDMPIALDAMLSPGALTVRVDPRRTDILVRTAIRVSGDVPDDARADAADRVEVTVRLDAPDVAPPVESGEEPDHHPVGGPDSGPGAVLRIVVQVPDDLRGLLDASVSVLMPRNDGVRVQATGQVVLIGVGGAMQVETERGAIEIRTAQIIDSPVALSTMTGNIFYQVPIGSTGRYDLQTSDGKAAIVARESMEEVYARDDVYRAVLNGGVNPVVLRSGEGDVRAWVIPDPVARVRMFR